jgi:hypothetical protein
MAADAIRGAVRHTFEMCVLDYAFQFGGVLGCA